MTPVRCTYVPGEEGDCWRACIASILNLPALDVPNFGHMAGDDWDEMYRLGREWLSQRGIGIFRTYCSAAWDLDKLLEVFSAANSGIPLIISGQSRRNPKESHAVIAINGKIIHDPSNSGLRGACACGCGNPACDGNGYWWIDVLAFAEFSQLAEQATAAAA